jgi:DNA-binding CsgD family transcriptional regulator
LLGGGRRTVTMHLTNIFGKIGVVSRTQAALWAVREGLATMNG